jgi:hypothetical protein
MANKNRTADCAWTASKWFLKADATGRWSFPGTAQKVCWSPPPRRLTTRSPCRQNEDLALADLEVPGVPVALAAHLLDPILAVPARGLLPVDPAARADPEVPEAPTDHPNR